MVEGETTQTTSLIRQLEAALTALEAALTALDTALTEAGRAVSAIRNHLPQVSALAEIMSTMESAMTLARKSLGGPAAPTRPAATPPLRPVPSPEPAEQERAPAAQAGSRALRLRVGSKSGSLDLKAVDAAVNENPGVVDVALLDYDGRAATLKLWLSETEDPNALREALLESLRRRLGDEETAEISIELEDQSAAA